MTGHVDHAPGDKVKVRYGSRLVPVEIIEDRGPLGVAGERIFRVAWTPTGSDVREELDIPESRILLADSNFEEQVRLVLEHLNLYVTRPQIGEGHAFVPDYVAEGPQGRFVVEAKEARASENFLRQLENQLQMARESFGATDALLVVPSWDSVLMAHRPTESVSIVPLSDLSDWFASRPQ